MAKMEESEVVIAANIRGSISSISYLIEHALVASKAAGPDGGRPYGDSRMTAKM